MVKSDRMLSKSKGRSAMTDRALLLDCETTGLVEPEVIEAAWLELSDPKEREVVSTYHGRFRPSKRIEFAAMATHHILDRDLVECRPSSEFRLPHDTGYLIGHNVDYDWTVVGKPEGVKRIDLMAMVARLWTDLGRVTLATAMYALLPDQQDTRQQLQRAHSASRDVANCLHLLWPICEQAGGFETWEQMWAFSEEARVPTHWPFGKHRGKPIEKAPYDYREWVLAQPDMDKYVVRAVKRTMSHSG